jgi:hypothetical protein
VGEDVALLAAYLLSSGRGLVSEPATYAPFRLIEGARRALEILEHTDTRHPRFAAVRSRLDELAQAPMGDLDFTELLDEVCQEMAEGLRALAVPPQGLLSPAETDSGSAS